MHGDGSLWWLELLRAAITAGPGWVRLFVQAVKIAVVMVRRRCAASGGTSGRSRSVDCRTRDTRGRRRHPHRPPSALASGSPPGSCGIRAAVDRSRSSAAPARGRAMCPPRPPAARSNAAINHSRVHDGHRFEHQAVSVRSAEMALVIAGIEFGLGIQMVVDDCGFVVIAPKRRTTRRRR